MIAEELINQMIPPLKTSDTAQMALSWMNEFRLSQLAVVEEENYKGIIHEDQILESNDLNKTIGEFEPGQGNLFALKSAHIYDVIKLATQNNLQVIAVVDENNKFLGVISINDMASLTAKMIANHGPGGIIVLSMKQTDYSLSEISRLIESNDTKILSSFLTSDDSDPTLIKLTLKLNKGDLSRVIATLERYNYNVIAQFQETELLSSDKERFDLLLKYLNI